MLKLLDYFEDKSYYYIVTENFPTGDLHNYHSAVPEIEAKKILKQIVRGIKALHKRNIMHRDIKERNIFVNKRDNKQIKV